MKEERCNCQGDEIRGQCASRVEKSKLLVTRYDDSTAKLWSDSAGSNATDVHESSEQRRYQPHEEWEPVRSSFNPFTKVRSRDETTVSFTM